MNINKMVMYNFRKPLNPKYGDIYWKRNPDDSMWQLMYDNVNDSWTIIGIGNVITIEDEIYDLIYEDITGQSNKQDKYLDPIKVTIDYNLS